MPTGWFAPFRAGRKSKGGNLDAVVEYGGVPKAMLTSKLDIVLETADDGDDGSDDPIQVTATALDAPLVYLTDVAGTGNDVKFKAGAELSKAVN